MAISSPLLEASIDGAHGVLLSIQGGSDLGLFEINEAAQLVSNSAAVDANIIFGAVIDDALGDEVRVTVIAAGLDEKSSRGTGGSAGGAESGGSSYGSNGSSRAASSSVGPGGAPETSPAPAEADQGSSNGSYLGSPVAAPDTSFAPAAGALLGAPVPDDGLAPPPDPAYEMPRPEPAQAESPERPE